MDTISSSNSFSIIQKIRKTRITKRKIRLTKVVLATTMSRIKTQQRMPATRSSQPLVR
jgi:hypothetical protein